MGGGGRGIWIMAKDSAMLRSHVFSQRLSTMAQVNEGWGRYCIHALLTLCFTSLKRSYIYSFIWNTSMFYWHSAVGKMDICIYNYHIQWMLYFRFILLVFMCCCVYAIHVDVSLLELGNCNIQFRVLPIESCICICNYCHLALMVSWEFTVGTDRYGMGKNTN